MELFDSINAQALLMYLKGWGCMPHRVRQTLLLPVLQILPVVKRWQARSEDVRLLGIPAAMLLCRHFMTCEHWLPIAGVPPYDGEWRNTDYHVELLTYDIEALALSCI